MILPGHPLPSEESAVLNPTLWFCQKSHVQPGAAAGVTPAKKGCTFAITMSLSAASCAVQSSPRSDVATGKSMEREERVWRRGEERARVRDRRAMRVARVLVVRRGYVGGGVAGAVAVVEGVDGCLCSDVMKEGIFSLLGEQAMLYSLLVVGWLVREDQRGFELGAVSNAFGICNGE